MAARTTVEAETGGEDVFLVTRRELAVLAVTLAIVIGAVLLLVVTGGRIVGAIAG